MTLLVVDWAPAQGEGDKMLFVFDAGLLTSQQRANIKFGDGELVEWKMVHGESIKEYMPERLVRRLKTAIRAKNHGFPIYAEHGIEVSG